MEKGKHGIPKEAPFYCLTCKRVTVHTLASVAKTNLFCEITYVCNVCSTEKKVKAQNIC